MISVQCEGNAWGDKRRNQRGGKGEKERGKMQGVPVKRKLKCEVWCGSFVSGILAIHCSVFDLHTTRYHGAGMVLWFLPNPLQFFILNQLLV
jgi:hypothetical protein